MQLNFEESFFVAEEIEGFFVEEKMKHAWAAQMQVVSEFDEVCKENSLTWFAAYGTLLGVVRHRGFIPWDDDIDIWMPRKDYDAFRKKIYKMMPQGYAIYNFHNTPDYGDYMSRLVNHPTVDYTEDNLARYHGCPYACGIDIFPLDYIPRDKGELEVYNALVQLTSETASNIENKLFDYQDEKKLLSQIEKTVKQKLDRGRPIPQQLRIICESIVSMYGENAADRIGSGIRQFSHPGYNHSIKDFSEIIRMPFGIIEMNVPIGYEEVLKKEYGEEFMVPRQYVSHDYPFYKAQDEAMERLANGQ